MYFVGDCLIWRNGHFGQSDHISGTLEAKVSKKGKQ